FDVDNFRYLLHVIFCCCSLKLVSVVAAASTSSSHRRWFRWWDCVALPDDIDSSDEDSFRMQIKELAFKSLQLLKKAIFDKECEPLFSLDIYGHIIGMFEQNNLCMNHSCGPHAKAFKRDEIRFELSQSGWPSNHNHSKADLKRRR
ncbi:hypothetical protein S83_004700, partial [Arachis hypogaea]